MKGEVLNSQAFVLEAALRISLKKVTSEVKFAERKSVLLQNKIGLKKLCLLFSYKVTLPLHLPIKKFMSKWHLIQPLQKEIYKKPTLIS